jgi:starch synthase
MVRSVGGLKDTVIDFGDDDGYGIRFEQPSIQDLCDSVDRALELYREPTKLNSLRRRMMKLDFSWSKSTQQYIDLYYTLK